MLQGKSTMKDFKNFGPYLEGKAKEAAKQLDMREFPEDGWLLALLGVKIARTNLWHQLYVLVAVLLFRRTAAYKTDTWGV